jgi:hypothetical protein
LGGAGGLGPRSHWALTPVPRLVIATKVGPGRDPSGAWLPWAAPEQLRGQAEENLRQLGRDHLDLVYLRVYGPGSIAEHFGAPAQLCEAGLIRHLGVSRVTPDRVAAAQDIAPVVRVQHQHGIGTTPQRQAAERGEEAVATWVKEPLKIVTVRPGQTGFKVIAPRWIAKRTLSWLMNARGWWNEPRWPDPAYGQRTGDTFSPRPCHARVSYLRYFVNMEKRRRV